MIPSAIPEDTDPQAEHAPLHPFAVRFTHWLFSLAFLALVFSSLPILIAHPRFYWGETGGLESHALFTLPLPLRTGRSGWGRGLHFLAAWIALFAGIVYIAAAIWSGHLRRRLLPTKGQLSGKHCLKAALSHLAFDRAAFRQSRDYNILQRLAYLAVVFVLFPVILLTGLAMSPAITSAVPQLVQICGGHQSARTLHFFSSQILIAFFVVHLGMLALAGVYARTREMITGAAPIGKAG